jgi:hypothetical protein
MSSPVGAEWREVSSSSTARALEFHGATRALAELTTGALASRCTGEIASADIARAMTALLKLYAAKAEAEGALPAPVLSESVTPTEAVLFVSELLRALDISLFDLAMWYRRGERQ